MSKARILIVHSEPSALTLLSSMLKSLGHEIDEAANDRVAVRLMERGGVDLLLAGVDPTDAEALELLCYMRRKHRRVPVILLLTTPSPERAKEALRLGALAVLRYPVPATELRAAVTQALALRGSSVGPGMASDSSASSNPTNAAAIGSSNPPTATIPVSTVSHAVANGPAPGNAAAYAGTNGNSISNGSIMGGPSAPMAISPAGRAEMVARELGIVGYDPSLRQAIELAGSIAASQVPVLIVGEPGTGKSLLARMIHALSPRRDQALVVFDSGERGPNSAPITPEAQSEIENDWNEKIHQSHGGTLLIDEVAGLSDMLQARMFQLLQERDVEGNRHFAGGFIGSDVRFLLASSESLPSMVDQGQFRQDLYHRLSIICLKLPPLRHRSGDIEALAEHFRARFAHEFAKNIIGFTHDALDALIKHDWPGNIRELEGVVRRGVVLCQGTRITSGHLASSLSYPRGSRGPGAGSRTHVPLSIRPLKEALEEPEKRIIIQALQALNWNRQETARVLDINRTTLYKKMKKYGLLVDGPIWVN